MGKVLSDYEVLEVWNDLRSASEIALDYNCSASTIHSIRNGRRRVAVTGGPNVNRLKAGENVNCQNFKHLWKDPIKAQEIKDNQRLGALRKWASK